MKKVIVGDVGVVHSDSVEGAKFYSVENSSGFSGFITRIGFYKSEFFVAANSNLTLGNRLGITFSNLRLSELVIDLLNAGFEVFEFDTSFDLFQYLGRP